MTPEELVYTARSLRYDSARLGWIVGLEDKAPGQVALWVPGDPGYGPFYIGEWDGLFAAYSSRPAYTRQARPSRADLTAMILKGLNL